MIGIRNGTRIDSQEEEELSSLGDRLGGGGSTIIGNGRGPTQISAVLGVIQLPPGAAISIKERTKVKIKRNENIIILFFIKNF